MRPLNPTEKSLTEFYERTEATFAAWQLIGQKSRFAPMNPTKADVERMFPKHAAVAWKVVDELTTRSKKAFARPCLSRRGQRDLAHSSRAAGLVAQEWRGVLLASDLPVFLAGCR